MWYHRPRDRCRASSDISAAVDDPFLNALDVAGKKWIVLTDEQDQPKLVLDADGFLRNALFRQTDVDPLQFCHQPIIVTSGSTAVGSLLPQFHYSDEHADSEVIDHDVILLWETTRRVITGADVFGRLLKGIAQSATPTGTAPMPRAG